MRTVQLSLCIASGNTPRSFQYTPQPSPWCLPLANRQAATLDLAERPEASIHYNLQTINREKMAGKSFFHIMLANGIKMSDLKMNCLAV